MAYRILPRIPGGPWVKDFPESNIYESYVMLEGVLIPYLLSDLNIHS